MIETFKNIQNWQTENLVRKMNSLNKGADKGQIAEVEKLLDEKLPDQLRELYITCNGEKGDASGCFFGHRFLPLDEVAKNILFGLSLVKPETRTLTDPEKSEQLINKIVDFYYSKAPKKGFFKKTWDRIEFSCGVGYYGGPYLYKPDKKKEIIKIGFEAYKELSPIIKELHELEKDSYNWDELEFVLYYNKKYDVKRTDYNFNEEISFTSTPEGAIKKMYFNPKWIPVFSDHGGNFIGVDLDPDVNGKKGQIIIFGRDEDDMFVLSDNIADFFEWIIKILRERSVDLKKKIHLHEVFKEMIRGME